MLIHVLVGTDVSSSGVSFTSTHMQTLTIYNSHLLDPGASRASGNVSPGSGKQCSSPGVYKSPPVLGETMNLQWETIS